MKLALAALLLAGCYRPSLEDSCRVACAPDGSCPNGSECKLGRCAPIGGTCSELPIDGDVVEDDAPAGDAPVDGPFSALCVPGTYNGFTLLTNGSDFTMSSNRRRAAVRIYNSTSAEYVIAVAETTNDVDQPSSAFVESIAPSTVYTALSAPRMSPDGTKIYLHAEQLGSGAQVVSLRNGVAGWGTMMPLSFQTSSGLALMVSPLALVGTPSATSPKRMPLSVSTDSFDEFEETSTADTWKHVRKVTSGDLGVIYIREPAFTADGRRVVFIGSTAGNTNNAIYLATRQDPFGVFGPAQLLLDDPNGIDEGSPFFTIDCTRVIYTNRTGGSWRAM